MARVVPPSGPIPARLMIIGEAPGADEEIKGIPFVGASGLELDKMLGIAGISRAECFVTNVARERPPSNDIDHFIHWNKTKIPSGFTPFRGAHVSREIREGAKQLVTEIEAVKPNIIVALGNTPLWALTGNWGITKWRGSMLSVGGDQFLPNVPAGSIKLIPTIHPAAVLYDWSYRSTCRS